MGSSAYVRQHYGVRDTLGFHPTDEQRKFAAYFNVDNGSGKIRGVNLSEVAPLPEERGPAPFTTYKYNIRVMGHYDQIGEFLGDIASLQRIIVPVDLSISPANPTSAKVLGDSSGAMLEAKFQIRTYVKSASAAEGEASGT